jgi:hypothetical protein
MEMILFTLLQGSLARLWLLAMQQEDSQHSNAIIRTTITRRRGNRPGTHCITHPMRSPMLVIIGLSSAGTHLHLAILTGETRRKQHLRSNWWQSQLGLAFCNVSNPVRLPTGLMQRTHPRRLTNSPQWFITAIIPSRPYIVPETCLGNRTAKKIKATPRNPSMLCHHRHHKLPRRMSLLLWKSRVALKTRLTEVIIVSPPRPLQRGLKVVLP